MHHQILVFIYDESRVLQEYSERMREMGIQLLRGISKSLGHEECYIEKKMKLESGYNILGPNFYQSLSRCSDDKNQIGQFPHQDPVLLVLIAQNVGGGLQIKHQGKWLNADFSTSSIGVLVADNIEVGAFQYISQIFNSSPQKSNHLAKFFLFRTLYIFNTRFRENAILQYSQQLSLC